jgi:hypothetical protein
MIVIVIVIVILLIEFERAVNVVTPLDYYFDAKNDNQNDGIKNISL